MAKLAMLHVDIFAHRTQRKALLEYLQGLEIMDIAEQDCRDGFFRQDTAAFVQGFLRSRSLTEQALQILGEYAPEKRGLLDGFRGRRIISPADFETGAQQSRETLKICEEIVANSRKIAENAAEAARKNALIPQFAAWEKLDVPMLFEGTRQTAAWIGALPLPYDLEHLYAAVGERFAHEFYIEILHAAPEQTLIFALSMKADAPTFEQALRGLGFMRAAQATHHTPAEKIGRLQAEIEALQQQTAQAKARITELAQHRRQIELTYDYLSARAEKYKTIGLLDQTRHIVVVSGYMAAQDYPLFEQRLNEKFTVVLESRDAIEEDAPVKLQNNAFTAPAAPITEMYAMPSKQDIDPTPLMSFFYYLFFGLMLSDAGYGLLMILGCLWILKKYEPEGKMRRNMQLFLYCGISTCFWGVMFGSYFGNAIPVLSSALFGKEIVIPPVLFDPMAGSAAVSLLIMSLAFGLCQILAGLGADVYKTWRNGDKWEALLGSGAWIVILSGIALVAGGMVGPPVLQKIGIAVALFGVVLLFANGIRKKGLAGIFSGFGSLYGITSYVSDLMSFSRLMALGLTTAAMSQVFNQLSMLGGRSIVGTLLMFVVFIAGHLINFGLNALGAYVHTLRLQYVELFSKFYEGGGKPFTAFSSKSKYTKIREEK